MAAAQQHPGVVSFKNILWFIHVLHVALRTQRSHIRKMSLTEHARGDSFPRCYSEWQKVNAYLTANFRRFYFSSADT